MSREGSTRTEEASPADRGGWGGRRAGAGRPRRGRFAPLRGDLEYAKELVSHLMRDEGQPAELRARCALAILIRGGSPIGRPPATHPAGPVDVGPEAAGSGQP